MEIQLYRALLEAGITEATATNVVDSLEKEIHARINEAGKDLATKSDLRADVAEIKAEIAKSQAEIIKWNVGAIFAAAGIGLALAKLFH